jgi:hypothetical protein
MSVRKVSEALKKLIAGRQNYKCANMLNSEIVKNYNCPLWENKERNGSFGEEGYQIDHIVEHSISKNDAPENLQALCLSCHSVKTKRFMITTNFQTNKSTESSKKRKNIIEQDNQVYEIDALLDKRRRANTTEYLVKWAGYKFSESTWEPKENIKSKSLLKNFEKEYKLFKKVK